MPPKAGFALVVLAATLCGRDAQAQISRCVEARVGGEVALNCLNDAWAQTAERAHGPRATNTLTATSPAPAVGTFSRTATAERMGNTFGHSAFSQRPAAPVYVNPLLPASRR